MHLPVARTLPWLVTAVLADLPAIDETDAELVRLAQQDLRKFTDLYERYVQRVYRYLLVRVGSVTDAEDLTSQTFMAALENLHRYRGERPFLAWLFGIARHKRADFYRKQKSEANLETAVSLVDPKAELADEYVTRQIQLELISQKLEVIAPDRAEAIALRLFGGMEIPEIAQFMGKQEAAVRMLIHRGLRDLQAQLNPEEEELL
jgi:RNA polymerase sigma-70 factor (ECF subfamily)